MADDIREIRIVYRFGTVGPKILHLVTFRYKAVAKSFFELKARVVRRDGNFHGDT